MAIEKTYLLGKNITLGCGFDLQAKAPLDSRQVVPEYAGLQALIDGNAAYEGMIVYDEGTKKTYQAQIIDGVLAFREFGLTEAELKDLIASETTAAMEFKGAATALPENPAKGDFYKVTAEFAVGEDTAKVGDSIVYDGAAWCIIPSGDDIEDTWRPVTDVNNDATLTFVAGDKLEKTVAADGTITYKHVAVDAPELLAENEQTRTYITEVETDGFGHITGYKTATENVVDTNTTYEFEGQAEESSVYFTATSSEENADPVTVYLDAYSKNEADGKFVAKETGKSLVADDEIARLANVDNYDDEEVRGLIGDNAQEIEDLADYVGTIPTDDKYKDLSVVAYINKKAEETLAAAQGGSSETAASVKQQLDNYKSENDTRVKAVEDDIKAINDSENGILKQAQNYADGLAGNYDENGAAAGVKDELNIEINKKVDKVEGKDLISTSEIERLATLANYDDTQVKADIAKKADAEAMTTELGKKVDKVDGKDLIATSEIERLATLKNYDDTALAGRMTTAEGKITALETESAKHALKTELEAVDAKFANYKTAEAQKAIDDEQDRRLGVIEGDYLKAADIANFETKENVKKVSDDLAAYIESNDAAVANRYTKDEADGKFALKGADAYNDAELRGLISGNADAIATKVAQSDYDVKVKALEDAIATKQDIIPAETYDAFGSAATAESNAKSYVDGKFEEANLAQYTTEQEVKDIVDGVIAGAVDGDTITGLANLVEYLNTHGSEAKDMGAAIDVLEGKVETIEGKPAYGILSTDIAAWNGEIGAKALAETKLDASDFDEYSNAHASDYTNTQIDTAISTAIDGLGSMSTKDAEDYYTAEEVHGVLGSFAADNLVNDFGYVKLDTIADSLEKADSAVQENTVVTFTSVHATEMVNAPVVSLAGGKIVLDGEEQIITLDKGLVSDEGKPLLRTFSFPTESGVLATASEVSTAKQEAIAAAKTETENQIKALAGEGNTSTVKKNADDIADIMAMLTWGSF